MKKNNFVIIIAWGGILGIILAASLILNDIHFNFNMLLGIILSLILIIVIVFAVALCKAINDNRFYKRLLDNGEYDELIKLMKEKHNKLDGKMGYKQQHLANIANCCGRMGNFQESLNYLKKIDEEGLDKYTKASYYGMYAENLFFLNEDLMKAEELIDKSRELLDCPEAILVKALISLELDKKEESSELIELYHKKTPRKKYEFTLTTVLYFDEYTEKVSGNFMLGLYYKKVGELEKAKKYFSQSAHCSYKNYFSDKGRELYISLDNMTS